MIIWLCSLVESMNWFDLKILAGEFIGGPQHPVAVQLMIRLMLEPCNGWLHAVVGILGCLLAVEVQSHLLLLHERLQVGDKNVDLPCGA